jgi:spoIIIJ-associated protein
MNDEPKRRFFSGDTLQQALIQAANHFHIDPEEIAYRSIEKRHGFLRTRRKVLIEVDPDAPRRDPAPPPPQAPAPAAMPAPPPEAGIPSPGATGAGRPERPPAERGDRGGRGRSDRGRSERGAGGDRGARPPRSGDRPGRGRGDRPDRGGDRGRREGLGRGPQHEGYVRQQPSADRLARSEPASFDLPPASSGLIALPDMPRRPSERYAEATGPQAEAAAKGMELLLRIAGLELTPRILQGEDRLEVDLSGDDVDWCFADDGEFVVSVEHLLPRIIRSLSGEATLVRVDCDNFQEIREERLRSLAQRVAEEVRRKGRPRTLEPMNPADRRIVHITLADDPGVVSESSGDGYFKRVTIRPA